MKINSTVLILILLLLTLFGASLIFERSASPSLAPAQTKEHKAQLKQLKEKYEQQMSQYREKEDSLKQKLNVTTVQLQKEQRKVRKLKTEIRESIKPQNWDSLSNEQKLVECDTLRENVSAYLTQQETTDSLKEEKTNTLEQLYLEKDNQFATCDSTLQQAEQLLEQSLADNEQQTKEMKKLKRKLKRKQILNKVAGVGLVVVSGIALVLSLK